MVSILRYNTYAQDDTKIENIKVLLFLVFLFERRVSFLIKQSNKKDLQHMQKYSEELYLMSCYLSLPIISIAHHFRTFLQFSYLLKNSFIKFLSSIDAIRVATFEDSNKVHLLIHPTPNWAYYMLNQSFISIMLFNHNVSWGCSQ